ncbi:MAG: lipoprotein signal peptidase [Bacteroidales bacterium]
MKNKKGLIAVLLIILILIIDQWSKLWIKTNMSLGESIPAIGDWFYIYFQENPGMAFGTELFNKLFLTIFRIIASVAIAVYIYRLSKKDTPLGLIICIAAILAGALGNTIDCVFYGKYFTSSSGQIAQFVSDGSGYAPWFYGHVVDMFYFPMIETTLPSWLPIWGGKEFVFFRYIFNVADSSVFMGSLCFLLFYRNYFSKDHRDNNIETNTEDAQTSPQ